MRTRFEDMDHRLSAASHTAHGSHGTSALVSLRGSVAQPLTRAELAAKWTIGSEIWAWKSFKSTASLCTGFSAHLTKSLISWISFSWEVRP
jgi:hypothetical protein